MTIDPLIGDQLQAWGYCPCGEEQDEQCECGPSRLSYAQGLREPRRRAGPTCVFCGEERGEHEFEDGLRCVYCQEADK